MSVDVSFLDLVELVDSFPHDDAFHAQYYKLYLPQDLRPHGYLHPDVVSSMPWTEECSVDHTRRVIELLKSSPIDDVTAAVTACFKQLIDKAIDQDIFSCIARRHSEPFLIPGLPYPAQLERFATSLFGITTRGAHMTAYTFDNGELKLWIPRRSQNVGTWKGMLDSTVAGGVAAGESPFENIVREAAEEASLPASVVRENAKQVGVLTYMGLSKGENGWEKGMALPDMVFVHDIELPRDMVPRPCDDEVKEFYLMSVDEVKQRMLAREFKPNCAVIMLDFLIRRGYITSDTERDYVKIVQRMHRRLPFPV